MIKQMIKKDLWCSIGMFVGLAAVIVGIIFVASSADIYQNFLYSSDIEKCVFGADFYTEIYNVRRENVYLTNAVDNSIENFNEDVMQGFGALFILGGLVCICAFGSKSGFKLSELKNDADKSEEGTIENVQVDNIEA